VLHTGADLTRVPGHRWGVVHPRLPIRCLRRTAVHAVQLSSPYIDGTALNLAFLPVAVNASKSRPHRSGLRKRPAWAAVPGGVAA
jgi:hypothetical protein